MSIDSVSSKPSTPVAPKPIEPAKVEAPTVAETPKPAPSIGQKIGEGFDALKKKLMSISGRYSAQPLPPAAGTADLKAMIAAQRSAANAGTTAPKAPQTVADGKAVGGGGADNLPEVKAARANGARVADMPFDVGPGAPSVEGLIKASPQVDANPATTNDGTRCAAASTFNAMLIEQRPAQNAEAMEKYAQQIGYSPDPEDKTNNPPKTKLPPAEREAIDAFKKGTLTPKQAGVLQEMTYNMAKHNDDKREAINGKKGPDRMTADGMTTPGAAEVLSGLRANGGMSTLKEVSIQMQQSKASDGTPFGHATLSCQKQDGSWVSTNTWPDKNGEATVTNSPTVMDLVKRDKDGHKVHNDGAIGLVTLSNLGPQSKVSFAYPQTRADGHPMLVRGSTTAFDPKKDFKAGTLRSFDMYAHDLTNDEKIKVSSDTGVVYDPPIPYED